MSRCAPQHQALTNVRTLYIGRAAPQSTFEGLDSIQKPLCELYRKSKWDPKKVFDHMESKLHVFTSGLLLKPCNPLDKDVWYKMQDLESCSAVKAYDDPSCRGRLLFVPCDSATAAMSQHPPVFALIMKRTSGGMKITDCHVFICNSDAAALALVRATAQAYANPAGWTDERPSLVELGLERPEMKFDNECYVDDVRDDCTPEYYQKPKLSGFFYTPRADLIQKYSVKGEDEFGRPIGEGSQMTRPFICDEFERPPPAPAPAPQTALVVVQNDCDSCCSDDCCHEMPSCQTSCQTVRYLPAQQQYAMAPQQTQLMKPNKKSKKTQRQTNHYVQQSEVQRPQVQQFTDPNGDMYIVDGQVCNTGCGDPLYSKFLPRSNGAPQPQVQMYAMQNGMGDYGPSQQVEYVEYHGNGQMNGEDLYSRKLPGQGMKGRAGGGRNYDGNFILKQGDGYGGYGINMGALSIRDQY